MHKLYSINPDLEFVARQLAWLTRDESLSVDEAIRRIAVSDDQRIARAAEVLGEIYFDNDHSRSSAPGMIQVLKQFIRNIAVTPAAYAAVTSEFIQQSSRFRQSILAYAMNLKNSLVYGAVLTLIALIVSGIYKTFVLSAINSSITNLYYGLPEFTQMMMSSGIYAVFGVLTVCLLLILLHAWILMRIIASANGFVGVGGWLRHLSPFQSLIRVVERNLLYSYTRIFLSAKLDQPSALQQAQAMIGPGKPLSVMIGNRHAARIEQSLELNTLEEELAFQQTRSVEELAERLVRFRTTVNMGLQLIIFACVGLMLLAFYLPLFKLGMGF